MAFLVEEYGLLFFSAPATGSTAFIKAFQNYSLGKFYPESNIIKGGRRVVPAKHSTVVQMEEQGLLKNKGQLYKVVGVRNPFSFHVAKYLRNKTSRLRQVDDPNSWINKLPDEDRKKYVYSIKRCARQTFKQYLVQELGSKPFEIQKDFHVDIDFYIHQENVDRDFQELKRRLEIPEFVKIERVNVTGAMDKNKTYKDYYDKDDIELVYKMNFPFFEKFPEYSFDGLLL